MAFRAVGTTSRATGSTASGSLRTRSATSASATPTTSAPGRTRTRRSRTGWATSPAWPSWTGSASTSCASSGRPPSSRC
eukprot:9780817-Alexandrium_andersonii.AAC.1